VSDPKTVTRLLLEARDGDQRAIDELMPLVYDELRGIARRAMRSERRAHTLQATELVHEAYARLVDTDLAFNDRKHFFSVAARAMRRLLVDHARARKREKRGSGSAPVTLREVEALAPERSDALVELDQVLERLAGLDARKARAVELSVFGGLKVQEVADVLEVSPSTVERDLRMARAWLRTELG